MQLCHSYQTLPACFYTEVLPEKVPCPTLAVCNRPLAKALSIDTRQLSAIIDGLGGAPLPKDIKPIAQAYAGHQFGYLNQLGDGRALLLGECVVDDKYYDIQLKGSGKTPYSRSGDGKATLSAMLREYLISEAMYHLGIATTRSLAVIKTGEGVYRHGRQPGAILIRIADSHLRVGTFVYANHCARQQGQLKPLQALLDYAIARHYPDLKAAENPALALLAAVMEKQMDLLVQWSRVGFIHGVLNTDNIAISGETLDYGPCAFLDSYHPNTVFSSIDHRGRYAFANQAPVMHWNMARFAESLLPLIDKDSDKATALATQCLAPFESRYQSAWQSMLCTKLGLADKHIDVAEALLALMQQHALDYTNTFIQLTEVAMGERQQLPEVLSDWQGRWQQHLTADSAALMQANNPVVIPRNQRVEHGLAQAEAGDFSAFNDLLAVLGTPYNWQNRKNLSDYQKAPDAAWQRGYQTFCGT